MYRPDIANTDDGVLQLWLGAKDSCSGHACITLKLVLIDMIWILWNVRDIKNNSHHEPRSAT